MLSDNRKNNAKRLWSDFCMNPRGELWQKDENNFGSKLMKKMGWKKGDGLGKKGSGITEPIRLVQTHDNEGLGYQKQMSDYSWNWLTHGDDYNSLLNKLQEEHSAPSNGASFNLKKSSASDVQQSFDLEKKSKKSLKRVHYKRTIEGKNLSNRSQSDWKCILGIKRKKKHLVEPDQVSQENVEADQKLTLHTSTVCSTDYFMFKRRKLQETTETNEMDTTFCMEVEATENVERELETSVSSCIKRKKNKKKRKRKKLRKEQESVEENESGCSDSAIGSEVSSSCNGDAPEIVSSDGNVNIDKVDPSSCRTESEEQNVADPEGQEQAELDKPLTRTRDEKENLCQAEDSLLITRKFKKKKKKKRRKSKPISDMTNLEEMNTCQENDSNPMRPNIAHRKAGTETPDNVVVVKNGGILKSKVDNCGQNQKKSVRFVNKAQVGYVPARDSVRGGAWIWKRKALLASL